MADALANDHLKLGNEVVRKNDPEIEVYYTDTRHPSLLGTYLAQTFFMRCSSIKGLSTLGIRCVSPRTGEVCTKNILEDGTGVFRPVDLRRRKIDVRSRETLSTSENPGCWEKSLSTVYADGEAMQLR